MVHDWCILAVFLQKSLLPVLDYQLLYVLFSHISEFKFHQPPFHHCVSLVSSENLLNFIFFAVNVGFQCLFCLWFICYLPYVGNHISLQGVFLASHKNVALFITFNLHLEPSDWCLPVSLMKDAFITIFKTINYSRYKFHLANVSRLFHWPSHLTTQIWCYQLWK